MICRPRAGTRPDGTHLFEHRHPSIASPTHAGRRSFVSATPFRGRPGSAWGTQSGAGKTEGKENGGRPPPFPVVAPRPIVGLPRCGAVRMVAGRPGGRAIGNPPHPVSVVGRRAAGRGLRQVYSGCSQPRRGGSGAGVFLGRSCDRAIRARGPSREAAERPAEPSPSLRRRPAGDLQPGPGRCSRGLFLCPRGRSLMPASIVVGLQWGDEGKGKTTDFLAEQVSLVVRYQGGDNAGHTVVKGDEVLKLHLVPSGVLYPHITSVIGNGVVVNPETLIGELDMLTSRGIDVSRVRVSRSAHVIMPYHVALDRVNEARLDG